MTIANLSVVRGDDKSYLITITDGDEVAIDITGWTVFFTVKEDIDDLDAVAKIQKDIITHTDPTNGVTTITVTDVDTALDIGNYYYDVQVKRGDGTIVTILSGVFTIERDITIRTS